MCMSEGGRTHTQSHMATHTIELFTTNTRAGTRAHAN